MVDDMGSGIRVTVYAKVYARKEDPDNVSERNKRIIKLIYINNQISTTELGTILKVTKWKILR